MDAPSPGPPGTTGRTRFDTDTAVTSLGGGRYGGRMDTSWWIVAGPNGGYVAATILRAVLEEVATNASAEGTERRARSATFHYLRPPAEGEVEVEVSLDRVGRSVVNASATMTQHERTMVKGLFAVATDRPSEVAFDEDPGLPYLDGRQVPPPEDIALVPIDPERDVPMRSHYDLRWVIGDLPFRPGSGTDDATARSGGWIRLAADRPVDELVLCAMADAWMPPMFSRVEVPMAVPTVDLTVHFRGRPRDTADPWCFIDVASPISRDGYLVEHGRIHDRHGHLLAESRQLAVVT